MKIVNGELVLITPKDVVNGVLTIPGKAQFVSNRLFSDEDKQQMPHIKRLVFEEGVKIIDRNAFLRWNIDSVEFPKSLTELRTSAFDSSTIKEINFHEDCNLDSIDNAVFNKTINLKHVTIPKSVRRVYSYAFNESGLETVEFAENSELLSVGMNSFASPYLKEFIAPSKLEEFDHAILLGHNIKRIELNEGLKDLNMAVNNEHFTIKNLYIPSTISRMNFLLNNYTPLGKTIEFSVGLPSGGVCDFELHSRGRSKIFEIREDENGYKQVNGFVTGLDGAKTVIIDGDRVRRHSISTTHPDLYWAVSKNFNMITKFYAFVDEMERLLGQKVRVYPDMAEVEKVPLSRVGDYLKNRKLFNEIRKNALDSDGIYGIARHEGLLTYAIVLGILEQDPGVKNAVITLLREEVFNSVKSTMYGIKFNEKINLTKIQFRPKLLELVTEILKSKEIKYDTAKFDLSIVAMERFNEIIAVKKSPKMKDVLSVLYENQYGKTGGALTDLSKLAGVFGLDGSEFDRMADWYLESKTKQAKNVLDHVGELVNKVKAKQSATAEKLADTAKSQYTFEWINKDTPENAMLGYICNCCAKVYDSAEGVLQASILQENVQNLVIKDEHGTIVGKATAFFDIEQGYVHFNTIEMSWAFSKQAQTGKNDIEKQAFNAFRRGVMKMVDEYNKVADNKKVSKIVQVSVGSMHNDLENEVIKLPHAKNRYNEAYFGNYAAERGGHFMVYHSKEENGINQDESELQK